MRSNNWSFQRGKTVVSWDLDGTNNGTQWVLQSHLRRQWWWSKGFCQRLQKSMIPWDQYPQWRTVARLSTVLHLIQRKPGTCHCHMPALAKCGKSGKVKDRNELDDVLRKGALWRMLRIRAWIARFLHNSRAAKDQRRTGPATTDEISQQKLLWEKSSSPVQGIREVRRRLYEAEPPEEQRQSSGVHW